MKESSFTFQLYNAVTVGICVIGADFDVVYWNDTMQRWTGRSRESVLGKNIIVEFPNFDNSMLQSRINSVLKDGLPVVISSKLHPIFFPVEWPRDTNAVHEIRISSIFDKEKNERFAVFTIEDVTDHTKRLFEQRVLYKKAVEEVRQRKVAEQKLRKSERQLKAAIESKDKFFSIIAHDLKSPFASLLTYSDYMLSNGNAMSPETVEMLLQTVNEMAKSGYSLLDNLLSWSRMQTGRMQFKPEWFSPEEILTELKQLLALQASKKEITIAIANSKDRMYADVNMMRTVLRNLVSNALKFSLPKTIVRVIVSENGDQTVRLVVSDSGIGISKEDIPFLFDLSTQNSTPGTNNEKGTGLGLILCKEFIDMHKGSIHVESEVGRGTKFTVTIPQMAQSDGNDIENAELSDKKM